MDVMKYLPHIGAAHPRIKALSELVFAASFFALRLGFWTVFNVAFWQQAFGILSGGDAHSNGAVISLLVSNVLMTVLQWWWGYKLLLKMVRMLAAPASVLKAE